MTLNDFVAVVLIAFVLVPVACSAALLMAWAFQFAIGSAKL